MVNQKKQSEVEKIVETLQKNKNFSLIKFEKTTHQSLEGLRKELRKSNSTIKVVKNTILEKAVNKLAQKDKTVLEFKKKFFPQKNTSALLRMADDWSGSLAAFYKFTQTDKTIGFKCGVLDGVLYSDEELKRVAQLPSKNELVGKIISSFKNPSFRLVRSLKFSMQKFVYILSIVRR